MKTSIVLSKEGERVLREIAERFECSLSDAAELAIRRLAGGKG